MFSVAVTDKFFIDHESHRVLIKVTSILHLVACRLSGIVLLGNLSAPTKVKLRDGVNSLSMKYSALAKGKTY